MDSEKASLILNEKSLISNKNSLNYVKSFDVFQVPNTPDTSINLNTFQENLNDAIPELFDYYQSAFGSEEKHTISAFKSKIFSGPLRRLIQIAELSIDENLQPNNDSFWETFKGTFVGKFILTVKRTILLWTQEPHVALFHTNLLILRPLGH